MGSSEQLPRPFVAPPVREQGATDRLVREMKRLGGSAESKQDGSVPSGKRQR